MKRIVVKVLATAVPVLIALASANWNSIIGPLVNWSS